MAYRVANPGGAAAAAAGRRTLLLWEEAKGSSPSRVCSTAVHNPFYLVLFALLPEGLNGECLFLVSICSCSVSALGQRLFLVSVCPGSCPELPCGAFQDPLGKLWPRKHIGIDTDESWLWSKFMSCVAWRG